jgi:DNA repair protein RecO (recombination protein O)
MASEKTSAIVIRAVDFSETSLIVTLFTRDFGKLGALAKGARRLKGPFESALDLLALCRIVFLHKTSDALDLLTEAKLMRRFRPADKNLLSLYAGYYVAELLDDLTEANDPHPELFDLADETLAALSAGEPVARRVIRFELGMLQLLGMMPALGDCAECGKPVGPACRVGPGNDRIAFGLIDGGVLCPACRAGKTQVVSVHAGVLKTMSRLADPDGELWQRIEIDARALGELRGVLNRYLTHLLGKKPRMHEYLGVMSS